MGGKFSSTIKAGIRDLLPGYFALVMATGIISIAAHLLKIEPIAQGLFWFNKTAYIILWMMLIARLIFFYQQVTLDIKDQLRGPGFYTLVAGTCVLGSQYVLLSGNFKAASILWGVGLVLGLFLLYTIFSVLILKSEKAPIERGINGAWLTAVVAAQSISVLGTLIAGKLGGATQTMLFFTLLMYLLGGMFYILIIGLILYRLLFFKIEPAQLTPPYWINMGAVAITTLAGCTLILNANQWSFLGDLLPFLKGLTLFFWATATWWIPMLVILGVWRHIVKHFPLQYDPTYWSLVFPVGMYTACTIQLAKALELPGIALIPRYFIYFALFAWLATFVGLVYRLGASLVASTRSTPSLGA